jgi:hypothetical protein
MNLYKMGWNSWNTFRLEIDEDLVKGVADIFVEKGLKDAGLYKGSYSAAVASHGVVVVTLK